MRLRTRTMGPPFQSRSACMRIEAWGRGIARIFNACRQGGAPEPELKFDAGGVWMTFGFTEAYLKTVASSRVPQVTRQVTREPPHPVSDPVSDPVVQLLRVLIAGPLPWPNLLARFNLKHRHSFRTRYLRPALEYGCIEPTIPDKPNSRLQRYRLTAAGQAKVQAMDPSGN